MGSRNRTINGGNQWLVVVKGHLASLRPFRVRERLRNVRTVALDSLFGLPATSRMGRGKQPKVPKQLPRLLPVGEHLPVQVQEQLRVQVARRSQT